MVHDMNLVINKLYFTAYQYMHIHIISGYFKTMYD